MANNPAPHLPRAGMRYRLSVKDQWDVVHQVVFELQCRFSVTVRWNPAFFTEAERARVERRLETLIRQRLYAVSLVVHHCSVLICSRRQMNQAAPDEVDDPPLNPPCSRRELIRHNLPTRSHESDIRELREAFIGLAANRPPGAGEHRQQALGTENVWVLSRSGFILGVEEHPAVGWAHYLNMLFNAPPGHVCHAPDPHKGVELDFNGDHRAWIPFR